MHTSVAYQLSQQNRIEEAASHLHEALRLDPDYGPANRLLGIVLIQQRKSEEALRYFEKALEQDPDSHSVRYYLGITLLNLGKRVEAVQYLQEALAGAKASNENALVMEIERLLQSRAIPQR
jgi:tetratricopeptide (TPR) repeat protein